MLTVLVNKFVKDVGDVPSNEGAVAHEFAVYSVEDGLEVVPFAGVLGVKKVDEDEADF